MNSKAALPTDATRLYEGVDRANAEQVAQANLDRNLLGGKPQLAGGLATSSRIPGFKYIPRAGLVAVAKIFDEGVESHKEQAWNGLSPNFHAVNQDLGWVQERLGHAIDHASKALQEVSGFSPASGENHAGALLFAGMVLACHNEEMEQRREWEKKRMDARMTAMSGTNPTPEPVEERESPTERGPVEILMKEAMIGSSTVHNVYIGGVFVGGFAQWGVADSFCQSMERVINGRGRLINGR